MGVIINVHVHVQVMQLLALELPASQRWLPFQWMCLFCCRLILFPNFDCLVCFTTNETKTRSIKCRTHDTSLSVERTGLCGCIQRLETMTSFPIPEAHGAIVTSAEKHILLVDAHSVDYGIVTLKVLHKGSLGTLPLLDGSRAAAGKGELGGVRGQRANTLFVMRQDTHRLAGCEIP